MKKMLIALLLALLPMKANGAVYTGDEVLKLITNADSMRADLKAHNCQNLENYVFASPLYGLNEAKVKYVAAMWIPVQDSPAAVFSAAGLPFVLLYSINSVTEPALASFVKDYSCKIKPDKITLYFKNSQETFRINFKAENDTILLPQGEGHTDHGQKEEDGYYSGIALEYDGLIKRWLMFLAD